MATETKKPVLVEYHGYASADKEENSRELWVYSEELLPFLKGELNATEILTEIETNNGNETYKNQIKLSNSLRCIYNDGISNRAFPPAVRRGEQVMISHVENTDIWYWRSEGRNDNNRRLDIHRTHISATREHTPTLDDDNTYYIELDTRIHKRIRMSTSKVDGEDHRYLFEFDTDKSTVFIGDDYGNQIFIDSNKPRVCLRNHDKSLLDLDTTNIVMACKDDITISAKEGEMTIYAKKDINIETDDNLMIKSKNNTEHEVGADWIHKYDGDGSIDGMGTLDITIMKDITTMGMMNISQTSMMKTEMTSTMDFMITSMMNLTTTSMINTTLTATAVMAINSTAAMTLTSGAAMTLTSSGIMSQLMAGWILSFPGGGMASSGGALTMTVAQLQLVGP